MKFAPRDLLRTNEAIYRELDLGGRALSDDELIKLMIAYPDLIQRPIIERGHRAVLGRPTENILMLITEE
jgi:arsenate reductase